jgi:hypothetical protein
MPFTRSLPVALAVAFTAALASPTLAEERSRHADTWTFGNGCRMAWNADASIITLSRDPKIATTEGCASFSDPATGNLLIYTDGRFVWNGAGTQVHSGMPGDPSSMHSGVIVPVPGAPGTVYVFAHGATSSSSVQYARFDLTQGSALIAGSIGSVDVGASAGREGMLVIPHRNGVDYWLLVSGVSNINILAVTSAGVGAPTSVASGLSVWSNGWHIFTMSHQNDILAMSSNSGGDIALWDFDNATGTLSNRRVINSPRPAGVENREHYGGVFSPDGTKLYFAVLTGNDGVGYFYQYDLTTATYTQLDRAPSQYYFGDGRLGPDGKLYVAGSQAAGVHIIDNPNLAGTACGFRRDAILESNAAWSGCAVMLGLPQSPSPLVQVKLSLAVTINTPTSSVTTSSVTPSGSANAPNGSTVTVTVQGPSGTSTCSAVVSAAAWTCTTPITGLVSGTYTIRAVVTRDGQAAQDDATFCVHPAGVEPGTVCFEVCEDLRDNDADGYLDDFDLTCQPTPVACSVPVTPAAFTVALSRQTEAAYEDLFWPVSGDVDGDGQTEVLAARANPDRIEVLDGRTLAVESTIPVDGDRGDVFALANLDADPQLEVVTLVHQRFGAPEANRMIVADFSGGVWKVNISATTETVYNCGGNVGSGLGLGIADFNGDGKAEIFYGNEIWTYPSDLSTGCVGCITKRLDADRDVAATARHGCATYVAGSGAQGAVSVAADVLSVGDCGGDVECEGPELIVANQVFSVDLATPKMTLRRDVNTFTNAGTGYLDGFAAVADLDSDGDLDVVVHGDAPGGNIYVYDPARSEVVKVWNIATTGGHGYSPLTIADVFDEDLADDGDTTNGSVLNVPEVIFTRRFLLAAVNTRNTAPIWQLTTTDQSGSTSSAVFDFNGDGVSEIAYRDSGNIRVMYGGPSAYQPAGVGAERNYALMSCPSATMNEGPMVADIDDDGSAELAVVCGGDSVATLSVFESNSTPWRESRRVWNQPLFAPSAIDEKGRVYPVEQARGAYIPEGSGSRPLNSALSQLSALDLRPAERNRVPAIDAEFVSVTVTSPSCEMGALYVDVTVRNAGALALPSATPIAFAAGAPGQSGERLSRTLADATRVWGGSVPIQAGAEASLRFEVSALATPSLWVELNAGAGAVPECETTDNAGTEVVCVEEICRDEGLSPELGCTASAPYCELVGGQLECVPCLDTSAQGTDTGCSAAAPSCDPVTHVCGSCADDSACTAAGLCDNELPPTLNVTVDEGCASPPEVGTLDPVVEWRASSFTELPTYNQVMMQPVVGNLTDDNGDGLIDQRDVPDIAFTAYAGGAYNAAGVLRVISGLGQELFATDGVADSAQIWGSSGVALGDLDGNGRPEIVVGLNTAAAATVGVWEANVPGQTPPFVFKWKSNVCGSTDAYPNPAIANVDGVGAAEIIMPGPCVLTANGALMAMAATPIYLANTPFAVNLDEDPTLEIVGGGVVFDMPETGTTLVTKFTITTSTIRSFSAVADLDGDGRPEIVTIVHGTAQAIMFDPDGATDSDTLDGWTVTIDPLATGTRGGPPTLADFDGDGQIEVGVAAKDTYSVLETNGALRWSMPVDDSSSRVTGSSVFDFDGDGAAEVVYADQSTLWIYDGKTGAVRIGNTSHSSATLFEYPVIADVDRDGQAEIVVASNGAGGTRWRGITVIGSETNSWAPARPVWNQHAYSISNIGDDLSVPLVQVPNWSRWNNFRAGAPIEGLANWQSDLFIAATDECEAGCISGGPTTRITVVVGNRGLLDVSVAEVRAFIPGVEGAIASASVIQVPSGGSGFGRIEVPVAAWLDGAVTLEVRSLDALSECRTDNNMASLVHPPTLTDADADAIVDLCDSCIATGAETCDGRDNDCDGTTDEGFSVNTSCAVGVGACQRTGLIACLANGTSACNAIAGAPGSETCDTLDNDCDGSTDEGFSLGTSCSVGAGTCQRSGTIACLANGTSACNATAGAPGSETCDTLDNDCDGSTDEGFSLGTSCSVGVGTCQRSGTIACQPNGTSACSATAGAPGSETCDALDNDCDGSTDEGFSLGTSCSVGVGTCQASGTIACLANGTSACNATAGAPASETCDALDNDCDGQTDEGFSLGTSCSVGVGTCQASGTIACLANGTSACNATAGAPGSETCDALDNDCDGQTDEGFSLGTSCSVGVGTCQASGTIACLANGTSACNATAGAPGSETCDSFDNDCDGTTDEGFSLGTACSVGLGICQTSGTIACQPNGTSDCKAKPGLPDTETCDALDNDCDGQTDEGFSLGTSCSVGVGTCQASGTITCQPNGTSACNATAGAPGSEACDALDNDCDGQTDEGCDDDEDGFCDQTMLCPESSSPSCPGGCTDCDDEDETANPGGTEVCNGQDDDCRGGVDDLPAEPSTCGVGACAREGQITCSDGQRVDSCTAGLPSSDALCNGLDDDCDGQTDDDYQPRVVPCATDCEHAPETTCVAGEEQVPTCLPKDDGTACAPDACATAAACQGGLCVGTVLIRCDDGNPCTRDACDPITGCVTSLENQGISCDDGNACTSTDACDLGVCRGAVTPCGPHGPCEEDGVCNPDTGVCDYAFIPGCDLCDFDVDPPTLTCPLPRVDLECGPEATAGEPSARDACSAVTLTSDAPAPLPVGTTAVTFTGTDARGNAATCTTEVTVADTTPPALICPALTTVEGDPARCGAEVTLAVTATDACDGEVAVQGDTTTFYGPGRHTATFTAVDRAGQTSNCESVIEVTGLDAFDITCPETLTVDAPSDLCGYDTPLTATVVDPCAAAATLTDSASLYPIGTTTVTFSATRESTGAVATCATSLTVRDVTPPTLTCPEPTLHTLPTTLTATASDACGAALTVTEARCVRVTDDGREVVSERCDLELEGSTVRVTDAPPSNDGTVRIVYTLTATDPSGGTTSAECEAPVDPESLDHDGDGRIDADDNCPTLANGDQLDADGNGIGDACEDPRVDDIVAAGGAGCSGGATSMFTLLLPILLLMSRLRRTKHDA